jgi:flagellar hook assembly protein FlgD
VLTFRDTSVNPGGTYRYRAAWAASCGDGPSTSEVSLTMPGNVTPAAAASVTPELHAYPNPSSGPVDFVLTVRAPSAQAAKVRLFDMSGRWIADILEGSYAPGPTRVTWPRTDRAGRAVAPGYYEVIGTVGSERVRERIVLLP